MDNRRLNVLEQVGASSYEEAVNARSDLGIVLARSVENDYHNIIGGYNNERFKHFKALFEQPF